MVLALAILFLPTFQATDHHVSDPASFRQAIARAKPGHRILLAPGEYPGGFHFSNLHGTKDKPIVIGASKPGQPPRIVGGGNAIQLSKVSHIEIRDLVLSGQSNNGLNVDDGGDYSSPSHHVKLTNLKISDIPKGNHDGIKLSGLDNFEVKNCVIERWGGSGIDMVGCHQGVIEACTFRNGGDSGIQAKGGSSEVRIVASRFENAGQRSVNIGGSTGPEYFRPPLAKMPTDKRYEAMAITVEGCTFIGSMSPIAFVGVDGARVRFNTIYNPERWAIRILQETRQPGFLPCRNGLIEKNLIVFRSDRWSSGGVNVGEGTEPKTFQFRGNFWFCSDQPNRSKPQTPTEDKDSILGADPLFLDPSKSDFRVKPESQARNVGAHAFRKR
ncbi:MAG: right-handed parallel beta-helix repeat-containing protein [Chlorobia bacterium]|nr:right-handed parallel beta-helix repeat-containing protein [Fimbriimonadaceae bacterium]